MPPSNVKEQKRMQKKKERGAYSFEKQAIEREKARMRMAEIRAKKRVAASAHEPPNSAPTSVPKHSVPSPKHPVPAHKHPVPAPKHPVPAPKHAVAKRSFPLLVPVGYWDMDKMDFLKYLTKKT